VTVPNASLNNGAVVNESVPRRHRRLKIPVSVAYGTDLDEVEGILLDVAESTDLVRDRPNPRVRLREFGDSGLRVELLCWIDDPRLRGRATDTLLREIYGAFRAADVEIPYPQRDLRVRENVASPAGAKSQRVADGGSKAN
jgi:small-conductance mechanosensitive channel